jgi:hypothetical protein
MVAVLNQGLAAARLFDKFKTSKGNNMQTAEKGPFYKGLEVRKAKVEMEWSQVGRNRLPFLTEKTVKSIFTEKIQIQQENEVVKQSQNLYKATWQVKKFTVEIFDGSHYERNRNIAIIAAVVTVIGFFLLGTTLTLLPQSGIGEGIFDQFETLNNYANQVTTVIPLNLSTTILISGISGGALFISGAVLMVVFSVKAIRSKNNDKKPLEKFKKDFCGSRDLSTISNQHVIDTLKANQGRILAAILINRLNGKMGEVASKSTLLIASKFLALGGEERGLVTDARELVTPESEKHKFQVQILKELIRQLPTYEDTIPILDSIESGINGAENLAQKKGKTKEYVIGLRDSAEYNDLNLASIRGLVQALHCTMYDPSAGFYPSGVFAIGDMIQSVSEEDVDEAEEDAGTAAKKIVYNTIEAARKAGILWYAEGLTIHMNGRVPVQVPVQS